MMFNCLLFLTLAVFGTSAAFLTPGYVSNGFNHINGGYGTYGARVSDICHCLKAVVRPQMRTEITAIPAVQRFIRTEATPVLEQIPYSVSRRVDTPGYVQGALTGTLNGASGRTFSNMNGGFGSTALSGVSALNGGFVY